MERNLSALKKAARRKAKMAKALRAKKQLDPRDIAARAAADQELQRQIEEGIADVDAGRTLPLEEFLREKKVAAHARPA